MPETKYNIEIRFVGETKYRYINQVSSMHWALIHANTPRNLKVGDVRIRKVVKTIVWKAKNANSNSV